MVAAPTYRNFRLHCRWAGNTWLGVAGKRWIVPWMDSMVTRMGSTASESISNETRDVNSHFPPAGPPPHGPVICFVNGLHSKTNFLEVNR